MKRHFFYGCFNPFFYILCINTGNSSKKLTLMVIMVLKLAWSERKAWQWNLISTLLLKRRIEGFSGGRILHLSNPNSKAIPIMEPVYPLLIARTQYPTTRVFLSRSPGECSQINLDAGMCDWPNQVIHNQPDLGVYMCMCPGGSNHSKEILPSSQAPVQINKSR